MAKKKKGSSRTSKWLLFDGMANAINRKRAKAGKPAKEFTQRTNKPGKIHLFRWK